jgi:hypothetical protein
MNQATQCLQTVTCHNYGEASRGHNLNTPSFLAKKSSRGREIPLQGIDDGLDIDVAPKYARTPRTLYAPKYVRTPLKLLAQN